MLLQSGAGRSPPAHEILASAWLDEPPAAIRELKYHNSISKACIKVQQNLEICWCFDQMMN